MVIRPLEMKPACNHKFVLVDHKPSIVGSKVILFCENCGEYKVAKKMREER